MIDAVDERRALGLQPREHERRRSAQIRGHDGRAREPLDAARDDGVALDREVRAEALQLERVLEAILEDRLRDRRRALGDGVQAQNCACMSVGKPGYGAVLMSTACGRRPRMSSSTQSAPRAMVAPASASFCSTASRCSGRCA